MDTDSLFRLLRAFEQEGLEYALIGAAALNLHGIIRATEDMDILIKATEKNVARLKQALHAVYDDPDIEQITAEDLLGEYPAVRYYPPGNDLFLDILTRLGEAATYEDLEIEERDIEGTRVQLASPGSLYRLKKDTLRPIDRMDAEALRERFDLDSEQDDE